jgi:hypothetical protein
MPLGIRESGSDIAIVFPRREAAKTKPAAGLKSLAAGFKESWL